MRYNKQILLKNIGINGQKKLNKSFVALIGLGALGSHSASLLARAGVNLILVDRDIVELDNLQRQELYTEKDIGKEKSLVAYEHLKEINSNIKIEYHVAELNHKNLNMLDKANLILDCTDNLETRFLINEYSIDKKKPWIYTGIIANQGMILSFNNDYCFNCIFREPDESIETCDTIGLNNSVAALFSGLQVNEAFKILISGKNTQEMIYFDMENLDFKKIKVNKNPKCNTCNKEFSYINGKKKSHFVKLCGKNSYEIIGKKININNIKKYDYKSKYSATTKEFIAFSDGRVIIKTDSENKARKIYDKYFG